MKIVVIEKLDFTDVLVADVIQLTQLPAVIGFHGWSLEDALDVLVMIKYLGNHSDLQDTQWPLTSFLPSVSGPGLHSL